VRVGTKIGTTEICRRLSAGRQRKKMVEAAGIEARRVNRSVSY
jgi:hypothetical protein